MNHSQTAHRQDINYKISVQTRLKKGAKNMLKAIPKDLDHHEQRTRIIKHLNYCTHKIKNLQYKLHQTQLYKNYADSTIDTNGPFPLISIVSKEAQCCESLESTLQQFVESHYHEHLGALDTEILDFVKCRENMRLATVNEIDHVMKYFGHLKGTEQRFFQNSKCNNLSFTWTDMFDGHTIISKSIRTEKCAVLLKLAALYSQKACMTDRNTIEGLDSAILLFEKAAGILQCAHGDALSDTSSSIDMARSTVYTLATLMLAQAQECIWIRTFKRQQIRNSEYLLDGRYAASVAERYTSVKRDLTKPLQCVIPAEWVAIIDSKEKYYQGLADWYSGTSSIQNNDNESKRRGISQILRANITLECAENIAQSLPVTQEIAYLIADYLELTAAVLDDVAPDIVCELHRNLGDLPMIEPSNDDCAKPTVDALKTRQVDMFAKLGSLHFFNANCNLQERCCKSIEWNKKHRVTGLHLSGCSPARVIEVIYNTPGFKAGILIGDYIVMVGKQDVRNLDSTAVTKILIDQYDKRKNIEITIVVNYDMQNFEELNCQNNCEIPEALAPDTLPEAIPQRWYGAANRRNLNGSYTTC